MKLSTAAQLIAFGAAVIAGPAAAWEKVYSPYPHDTVCDAVNCFTPGTAYLNGHYHYLTCKDPHKILTYRKGVLKCVRPKYVAK